MKGYGESGQGSARLPASQLPSSRTILLLAVHRDARVLAAVVHGALGHSQHSTEDPFFQPTQQPLSCRCPTPQLAAQPPHPHPLGSLPVLAHRANHPRGPTGRDLNASLSLLRDRAPNNSFLLLRLVRTPRPPTNPASPRAKPRAHPPKRPAAELLLPSCRDKAAAAAAAAAAEGLDLPPALAEAAGRRMR
ncbi:hypothetical protein PVAP13_2NG450303 [Panicum virgatum]|uniref:Uncharacterized protein n=1 Tax=Panicum virgatum TaxID=38727 RepID=A0A8T0VYK1_PANVG|nr:hypothetical protein PVAP13_2NG450303 [Panicum virgatum]